MSNPNPGIVIVGPTASGKSRLGIALAIRFNGEILSCDALQIYRKMDIGTAKASNSEREQVPHHLLDLLDPTEEFSAGAFQSLARKSLEGIRERKHIPLIVGGTGFYLHALLEGLFEGPSREEDLRARMHAIIERKGPQVLHRALKRVDPQSASRISKMDGERIIRAYEIYLVSGLSMSWWQQQPRNALEGYRWLKIGIHIERERLYERINTRVDNMFRNGLLKEVQALLSQYPRSAPAFKAIGYRQVVDYMDDMFSLEKAIENTKMESRRYAKRQMTWFRRDPDVQWIKDEDESQQLERAAEDLVEGFLGEIGS